MANVLKLAKIQSIQQLHATGWSQRRIAAELEIDRGTVARHSQAVPPVPNAAIPPAGSGVEIPASTSGSAPQSARGRM